MTEMMKRYEVETDKQSAILKFMSGGQALEQKSYPKLGPYDYNIDYIAWLESKAEAYDRLMSGNPTPKEIANVLNRIIAMDADFKWYAFGVIPYGTTKFRWVAVHGSTKYRVPCFNIKFDCDWKDSLTLPDGWEER